MYAIARYQEPSFIVSVGGVCGEAPRTPSDAPSAATRADICSAFAAWFEPPAISADLLDNVDPLWWESDGCRGAQARFADWQLCVPDEPWQGFCRDESAGSGSSFDPQRSECARIESNP